MAGKTIVGGIVGGIIGVELAKKIAGEKRSSGDLFVFPLILGIGVGRIGCFLTGVKDGTVGNPSSLPWALDQGDGILRHPTALYEILYLVIVWTVLTYAKKYYQLESGILFKLFILLYLSYRLFIEFLKPVTPLIFNLSAIQIVSLVVVMVYLIQLWNHRSIQKK